MRAGFGALTPWCPPFQENMTHELAPLRLWPVAAHAGFPSPGEEYSESPLNLHDLIVQNPHATYFIRVRGQSMRGAGISPGDILVVDRSLTARHNQLAVVRVRDHLLIKRLLVQGQRVFLQTDPPGGRTIRLNVSQDMEIWGVITYIIHRV